MSYSFLEQRKTELRGEVISVTDLKTKAYSPKPRPSFENTELFLETLQNLISFPKKQLKRLVHLYVFMQDNLKVMK